MRDFEFYNPARVVFGKESYLKTGELLKEYGAQKVLLHYGSGSIKANGIYQKILDSLSSVGVEVTELGGVQPNPRLKLVREGIRVCKERNIDFVLAVGGGSVIDSSKAIAVGTLAEEDIWNYFSGVAKKPFTNALPIGAVLTIPAAGSETSTSAVITNEEENYKRPIGSNLIIPKFAIMNPEFCFTLSPKQIACGTCDIMAHMMERYFTNEKHVQLTDQLIEGGIRTVLYNAPRVLKDPKDYDSWAEIMWAGSLAHNNLLDTGRESDWASHDISHEISGLYDVTHGAALAIMFPAWMKYVYKKNIGKLIQFAVNVFGINMAFDDEEAIVLEMINRLEHWYQEMNLPVRLSQVGVGNERFEEMARKAMENRDFMGNYVKLDKEEIIEIFKLAQ